jgi:hypothetical protein
MGWPKICLTTCKQLALPASRDVGFNLHSRSSEGPVRVRIFLAAGLMAGVWAACSKPASDAGLSAEHEAAQVTRADFELALTDAAEVSPPLVSEIEAPKTVKRPPVRRGERRPASETVAAFSTDPAGEAAEAEAHENASHAQPAAELTVIAIADATPIRGVEPIRNESPSPADQGGPSAGEDVDDRRSGGGDRGPAVIIRGGRGSGRDPCAIHIARPERPEAGAFINERAPRIGFSPRGGLR